LMGGGRVGSSPSAMPESAEWAELLEMVESAYGEKGKLEKRKTRWGVLHICVLQDTHARQCKAIVLYSLLYYTFSQLGSVDDAMHSTE
jgi:hypothetical protein